MALNLPGEISIRCIVGKGNSYTQQWLHTTCTPSKGKGKDQNENACDQEHGGAMYCNVDQLVNTLSWKW